MFINTKIWQKKLWFLKLSKSSQEDSARKTTNKHMNCGIQDLEVAVNTHESRCKVNNTGKLQHIEVTGAAVASGDVIKISRE